MKRTTLPVFLLAALLCQSVFCKDHPAALNNLNTVDPKGEMTAGILAVTGTRGILSIDELMFVKRPHRDTMIISVALERAPDAGGIPEGVMHSRLFVVRDEVDGKIRIRVVDAYVLTRFMEPETNRSRSLDDLLHNLTTEELAAIKFDYDHTFP